MGGAGHTDFGSKKMLKKLEENGKTGGNIT